MIKSNSKYISNHKYKLAYENIRLSDWTKNAAILYLIRDMSKEKRHGKI